MGVGKAPLCNPDTCYPTHALPALARRHDDENLISLTRSTVNTSHAQCRPNVLFCETAGFLCYLTEGFETFFAASVRRSSFKYRAINHFGMRTSDKSFSVNFYTPRSSSSGATTPQRTLSVRGGGAGSEQGPLPWKFQGNGRTKA